MKTGGVLVTGHDKRTPVKVPKSAFVEVSLALARAIFKSNVSVGGSGFATPMRSY